jgi:serine phosphatase RsbU (regulator of sigma subunit)
MDRSLTKSVEARRILIIEDDPVVRFNMVGYLEDSGFDVTEADSGTRGIATARRTAPDLVLCDLRLPGLDGLEVLEMLNAEQPDLPVVVVSGTGVLSDAVDALRKGAWDFVTKPIQNMEVLEHAIDAALEKSRLIRDNRRYQVELQHANRLLRDNLDQFEQDAATGRNIQLQLMPPGERTIGVYRFNRYLLPSLYLSGDFVDYFVIDHRHLGFFLADVSGHGASSAFVTVLIKSLVDRYLDQLHSEGVRTVLDPAQVLTRLDADLRAQDLEKYVTIVYCVIDVDDNRLSYCNGGHFPSPVLFDGRTARYLDGRCPPVGLFHNAQFDSRVMDLPDSHVLVLVSDGVMDAMADSTLEQKRMRLLQSVDRPGLDAETLLASLSLSPETAYPDDITLLIAEREI